MLNNNELGKLLCAFIIGAAESGVCMNYMTLEARKRYVDRLKAYVRGKPYNWLELELEIFKNNPLLIDEIARLAQTTKEKVLGRTLEYVRQYVYAKHLYVVEEKLKKTYGNNLADIVKKNKVARGIAFNCPVMYYQVFDISSNGLIVENLFLPEIKKQIISLPGLEKPERGDIVSAHWNHMLEVIDVTVFKEELRIVYDYLMALGLDLVWQQLK